MWFGQAIEFGFIWACKLNPEPYMPGFIGFLLSEFRVGFSGSCPWLYAHVGIEGLGLQFLFTAQTPQKPCFFFKNSPTQITRFLRCSRTQTCC